MTNEEVINVLDGIYNNPTASEQVKEACIVAMEAVDIKNSVERITTGLQTSSPESEAKGTMTNKEAIENPKVWVIKNGDYSVVEVYQKDIGLFTQFFETKEEAEKIAEEYKQAEKNEEKETEELKGTMTNAEAIKTIKSIVETLDDYSFYTEEDKVAFDLAIKALEREESCENKDDDYMMFKCSKCGARSVECMLTFDYCPNCGRRVEK